MEANSNEEVVIRFNFVLLYEYLNYSALLINVLEFLNIRDLGRVDSVNTNREVRELYLMRLHQMNHSLFRSIQLKKAETKWVIKREIVMSEMVFPIDSRQINSKMISLEDITTDFLAQIDIEIGTTGINNITLVNCSAIQLSDERINMLCEKCGQLQDLYEKNSFLQNCFYCIVKFFYGILRIVCFFGTLFSIYMLLTLDRGN